MIASYDPYTCLDIGIRPGEQGLHSPSSEFGQKVFSGRYLENILLKCMLYSSENSLASSSSPPPRKNIQNAYDSSRTLATELCSEKELKSLEHKNNATLQCLFQHARL